MSEATTNRLPDMNTVTAHLICAGVDQAIDFYRRAFDATEEIRLKAPDGSIVHAAVRIGDSMVMLAEENAQWGALGPKLLNGSPVTLHLVVADVDAVVSRAVEAGARITMPVADMFWGDRYGKLVDPFGHQWSVATPLRRLTAEEMQEAMTKAFSSPHA